MDRESPLEKQFLDLFKCALVKEATVKSYYEKGNKEVIWSPIFRRNLRDIKERQFLSLLNLLKNVLIPEEGEDTRIWKASKDGSFSVASFYSANSTTLERRPQIKSNWNFKATPRIVIYGWLVL